MWGVALNVWTPNTAGRSRRLAALMVEKLAGYIQLWVRGQSVALSLAATELVEQHGRARSQRLVHGAGQRLCFSEGEYWREAPYCTLNQVRRRERARGQHIPHAHGLT